MQSKESQVEVEVRGSRIRCDSQRAMQILELLRAEGVEGKLLLDGRSVLAVTRRPESIAS